MTMHEMNSIAIPEALSGTVTESLNTLRKQEIRKKQKRTVWTVCSLAAAVVLVILVFTAYPALAENIPFLHGIFAEKQESFIAPGDYAEHASTLNPVEPTLTPVPAQTAAASGTEVSSVSAEPAEEMTITAEEYIVGRQYAAASSGFALIPSEVYCDGISVFVSMEIFSEKSIQELAGSDRAENARFDLAFGNVRIDGVVLSGEQEGNRFSCMDDHRLAGIVKLDLKNMEVSEGEEHELSFHLGVMRGDILDVKGAAFPVEHHIGEYTVWTKGSWSITIPLTVNKEELRIFSDLNPEGRPDEVNEVMLSPFLVQVNYRKSHDCECVVFTENGDFLEFVGDREGTGHDVFSLNGVMPQKLFIYVVDTRGETYSGKLRTPEKAEEYKLSMIELDLVE